MSRNPVSGTDAYTEKFQQTQTKRKWDTLKKKKKSRWEGDSKANNSDYMVKLAAPDFWQLWDCILIYTCYGLAALNDAEVC